MLDIQQKRKLRAVAYHKITLVVLSIILVLIIRSTWNVYQKKEESQKLKNIAIEYTEGLREKDSQIKSKIDRLSTEVGVEEEIRSKFNVAKDNENIVVVLDSDLEVQSTTTPDEGFWKKIKDFFKN